MSLSRTLATALAVPLLAMVVFAADSPTASGQDRPACARPGVGGMMQFLAPEQRMMMFADMQQATAAMTEEQRQAYRQSQRDKLMTMSDADRQAYAAGLQAKWDALSPDQQAKYRQQAQAFRAGHPMMARQGC